MRRPLVLLLPLLACGGESSSANPTPPSNPVLSIVSGSIANDTIEASLTIPLRVEITKSGAAVRGARVVFGSTGVPVGLRRATASSDAFAVSAEDVTDANGRAAVQIRLGTAAGRGHISIVVPSLGLTDSAQVTVKPGRMRSGFSVEPRDTVVYAEKAVRLRIVARDRAGNSTSDWRFSANLGVTATDGDSSVQTHAALGNATVVVTPSDGEPNVSIHLRVIPRDSMLIEQTTIVGTTVSIVYVTMELDGSNIKVIAPTPYQHTRPQWFGVDRFTFLDDTLGIGTRRLDGAHTTVVRNDYRTVFAYAIRPSTSGEWIYFAGYGLCRIHPDGTGFETLSQAEAVHDLEPLPDGSGVLVIGVTHGPRVLRFDVATRRYTDLGFSASQLRVSPQGDRLVYVTPEFNAVRIANLDGSGARDVVRLPVADAPLNWTKDGQWLLLPGQFPPAGPDAVAYYSLIRVSTGEQIVLSLSPSTRINYRDAAIRSSP